MKRLEPLKAAQLAIARRTPGHVVIPDVVDRNLAPDHRDQVIETRTAHPPRVRVRAGKEEIDLVPVTER